MDSLQTLPRGAACGNAPLHHSYTIAPTDCNGSCSRRTFTQSLYYECISWRTVGIRAGIYLVHAADYFVRPLAPGHICHSIGGTKIKQFPISWPSFFVNSHRALNPSPPLVLDILMYTWEQGIVEVLHSAGHPRCIEGKTRL